VEVDGGWRAENGDSVNWAFMRPSCGLHALTAVDGTAAGDAFCAALVPTAKLEEILAR
jgi:sugar/nucleoside kinase (ribokinase family)